MWRGSARHNLGCMEFSAGRNFFNFNKRGWILFEMVEEGFMACQLSCYKRSIVWTLTSETRWNVECQWDEMKCGVSPKVRDIDWWYECMKVDQLAGTGRTKANKLMDSWPGSLYVPIHIIISITMWGKDLIFILCFATAIGYCYCSIAFQMKNCSAL